MKRKSILTILATLMLVVVALTAFAACNKNKHNKDDQHSHTFASEWTQGETEHWHAATCEHSEEVSDKAAHTWNDGEITTAPTTEKEGVKTFTCTVCQKVKVVYLDPLEAKTGTIKVTEDANFNRTYGDTHEFPSDKFITNTRIVDLKFKAKGAGDETYSDNMPKNAGTYVIKVTTEATAEWTAATAEFEFEIAKKDLSYTGDLEYGKFAWSGYTSGINGEDVQIEFTLEGYGTTNYIDVCDRLPAEKIKTSDVYGDNSQNYLLRSENVFVRIIPKEVSVSFNTSYLDEHLGLIMNGDTLPDIDNANALNKQGFMPTDGDVGKDNYTLVWERKIGEGEYEIVSLEEITQYNGSYRVRIVGKDSLNYVYNQKAEDITEYNFCVYDVQTITNQGYYQPVGIGNHIIAEITFSTIDSEQHWALNKNLATIGAIVTIEQQTADGKYEIINPIVEDLYRFDANAQIKATIITKEQPFTETVFDDLFRHADLFSIFDDYYYTYEFDGRTANCWTYIECEASNAISWYEIPAKFYYNGKEFTTCSEDVNIGNDDNRVYIYFTEDIDDNDYSYFSLIMAPIGDHHIYSDDNDFECNACGEERVPVEYYVNNIEVADGKTLDGQVYGSTIKIDHSYFKGLEELHSYDVEIYIRHDATTEHYDRAPYAGKNYVDIHFVGNAVYKEFTKTFEFDVAKKELTIERVEVFRDHYIMEDGGKVMVIEGRGDGSESFGVVANDKIWITSFNDYELTDLGYYEMIEGMKDTLYDGCRFKIHSDSPLVANSYVLTLDARTPIVYYTYFEMQIQNGCWEIQGNNLVFTGKATSGKVRVGDKIHFENVVGEFEVSDIKIQNGDTFETVSSTFKKYNPDNINATIEQDTYQITVTLPNGISNFDDMKVSSQYAPTHYDGCNYHGNCETCLCHIDSEHKFNLDDGNDYTHTISSVTSETYYFTFITPNDDTEDYRIDIIIVDDVPAGGSYELLIYSDAAFSDLVGSYSSDNSTNLDYGTRYYVKATFVGIEKATTIQVVSSNMM